jgi:hypothetical protein
MAAGCKRRAEGSGNYCTIHRRNRPEKIAKTGAFSTSKGSKRAAKKAAKKR